jgi:hypothetical protein
MIEGRLGQDAHRRGEARPLLVLQLAGAHPVLVDATEGGHHAHGQGIAGHLHAEHRHRPAALDGGVFRDVHGEGGVVADRHVLQQEAAVAVQLEAVVVVHPVGLDAQAGLIPGAGAGPGSGLFARDAGGYSLQIAEQAESVNRPGKAGASDVGLLGGKGGAEAKAVRQQLDLLRQGLVLLGDLEAAAGV